MKNTRVYIWSVILGLTLCVPAVRGQRPDPQSNPPLQPLQPDSPPPAGEITGTAPGQTLPRPETQATPDTRPLSGAEQFTLGQMGKRRNYLLTNFDFFQSADTNPIVSPQPRLDTESTLFGYLALRRIWSHYEFKTEYTGGGQLYVHNSNLDATIQEFGMELRIGGRRWSALLTDQVSDIPESLFSFSGFGTTEGNLQFGGFGSAQSIQNTDITNLNAIFEPDQSILTTRSSRLANTGVAELDYNLSRKSTFTAAAGYGILRFNNSSVTGSFVNNDNAVFLAGYDYVPNVRNTLAVSYGLTLFRYPGQAQQIYDHVVALDYRYQITGRLALELSAGPEFYTISHAVTGPGQHSQFSSYQQISLMYSTLGRTTLRISYFNFLTGGAGVVSGANSHTVELTVAHHWSRSWSSSLDTGFAHSTPLAQTNLGAANLRPFNTWYGSATLSRPLGRYMDLLFDYTVQRQISGTTGTSLCAIAICGLAPARQVFGLGFDWHRPQIPL